MEEDKERSTGLAVRSEVRGVILPNKNEVVCV